MPKAHWHYPRAAFAETIYALLVDGPLQGVNLFGPRRTGKTEFLINDLAPLAESKGHRVMYASLWQTLDSPLAILLHELDATLRGGSFVSRLKSAAGDLAPKFKLKSPDGTGEVEVDLARLKGKAPESHLLLLDRYCERLANKRKPALLLFDEFQELARGPESKPLVAALRTSLDKRKDGLVAVFAGSSPERLNAMFTAKEAPFFRFATPVALPELDEAFVDHQLKTFRAASRSKVERKDALEVFERFERNPMFFQRWLATLALHPSMSAAEAVRHVHSDVAEEFDFAARWVELTPVQRVAARLIAERSPQLFGRRGAARWSELTGGEAPAPQSVQAAVKRLSRLGMVDKWADEWRIADPLFESWLRARPDDDF